MAARQAVGEAVAAGGAGGPTGGKLEAPGGGLTRGGMVKRAIGLASDGAAALVAACRGGRREDGSLVVTSQAPLNFEYWTSWAQEWSTMRCGVAE